MISKRSCEGYSPRLLLKDPLYFSQSGLDISASDSGFLRHASTSWTKRWIDDYDKFAAVPDGISYKSDKPSPDGTVVPEDHNLAILTKTTRTLDETGSSRRILSRAFSPTAVKVIPKLLQIAFEAQAVRPKGKAQRSTRYAVKLSISRSLDYCGILESHRLILDIVSSKELVFGGTGPNGSLFNHLYVFQAEGIARNIVAGQAFSDALPSPGLLLSKDAELIGAISNLAEFLRFSHIWWRMPSGERYVSCVWRPMSRRLSVQKEPSRRKRMSAIRKYIEDEIEKLEDEKMKEMKKQRDHSSSGTFVLESRKSVGQKAMATEQGDNIKLLTLMTIVFLTLTFVLFVFGKANMKQYDSFTLTTITTVVTCLFTYTLIGSWNATSGIQSSGQPSEAYDLHQLETYSRIFEDGLWDSRRTWTRQAELIRMGMLAFMGALDSNINYLLSFTDGLAPLTTYTRKFSASIKCFLDPPLAQDRRRVRWSCVSLTCFLISSIISYCRKTLTYVLRAVDAASTTTFKSFGPVPQ